MLENVVGEQFGVALREYGGESVSRRAQFGEQRGEDRRIADAVEAEDDDVRDGNLPSTMLDPAVAVTFDRLSGYRVVRRLGTASGEAVLPRSLLRSTLRSVGALIGLTPSSYLTDAERVRPECLSLLLKSAERLGANGVVRVRFESFELADGSTCLRAMGEAVILEPSP